jgi:hypothetical protein
MQSSNKVTIYALLLGGLALLGLATARDGKAQDEEERTTSKSEQERLAQTVSFWYYSFCPENCTQGNCPCVRLPYLKSQPQSKRLCCGNCAKAVMGIYSRFTFCSYAMPGRTRLKSLISSSARAQASIVPSKPIALPDRIGNEMADHRQA